MSELTTLYPPPSLPYPVTITALLVRPFFKIDKHTTIFKYKYLENQIVPTEQLEPEEQEKYKYSPKTIKVDSIGSFESPISGEVKSVNIKVGDVLTSERHLIAKVEEPCTHAIQFGGLCGICGANLADEVDYIDYNNRDRAPITMSHQNTNVTVSFNEAKKIEKTSTKKLLQEKKLILVVDLDQTVIQTINDPTVYAWQNDPKNPNYQAVKDVKSFFLLEKMKSINGDQYQYRKSWYYVKLRPGLKEFFEKIYPKYEMHIYTMATRDYAKEIAKIIDPDGKYFSDRILSRDESGSLTQKSLHRLFPTNTSMVVIIDDRGDVWQWSPNLIKVIQYDFFIGVGDINSGFLPKQNNLLRPSKRRKLIDVVEDEFTKNQNMEKEKLLKESNLQQIDDSDSDSSDDSDDQSSSDDEDDDKFSPGKLTENDRKKAIVDNNENRLELIVQQVETTNKRPLEELQQLLEKENESSENRDYKLLEDDDDELYNVGNVLIRVSDNFYKQYDKDPKHPPDIKDIIPSMKEIVLRNCHLLFSGVFPINNKPFRQEPEMITWAKTFGAKIEEKITSRLTHIISPNSKTAKVRLAKTLFDNIKIVSPDWLFACFSNCNIMDTKPFEIYFDEKDRLEGEKLQKLKSELFEEVVEEEDPNLDLIDNIDLSGADEELKDFLGSSDEEDNNDDDSDEQNFEQNGSQLGNNNDEDSLSDEEFEELEKELGDLESEDED